MKICPTCRRTYEDDGLNFCLDDGVMLNYVSSDAAPTVVMEEPRLTNPAPSARSRAPVNVAAPRSVPYSVQPKNGSSRTWPWVLAIVATVMLVCGGGFAGLLVYLASQADTNSNSVKGPNNGPAPKNANASRRNTLSSPEPGDVKEVDLSGWVEEPTEWLETQFTDGEFHMTSRQKGYYYVLVAKREEYAGAPIARVTLRNPDGQASELGYGLVFHSDVTPLTNDYAFLVDTKRRKFRVVRHQSEQEKTVTAWTDSNLIKSGSEPNTLEARDSGENIELYINGQRATIITNKQGPKSGVPGLYVGDGAKIAFRKLEVIK